MTATDELRKLLDERGVEWIDGGDGLTVIPSQDSAITAWEVNTWPSGVEEGACLWVQSRHPLTPEQAIAATLGRERETELQKALNKAAGNWAKADAELCKALDFMRIWISEDAHLGESELSAVFEKAEGLRNLDAIESAITATLGAGTCKNKATSLRTFWCDCCDCALEDWMDVGGKLVNGLRYCPNCGREVEE